MCEIVPVTYSSEVVCVCVCVRACVHISVCVCLCERSKNISVQNGENGKLYFE